MAKQSAAPGIEKAKIMIRIPQPDADKLELEAKVRGMKLATYCTKILIEHVEHKDAQDSLAPVIKKAVSDLLKSDDLDLEFGEKVAKSLSKRFQ